ncbi:OmpA family protein [Shewanella profunda]|uniref:OmpA family protein n=1 Tax=Shewanella profunda TaxID=254793 RepID=UPI00200F13C2|nr:OmpA family protein [Shewanella profunda]MCL1089778.1 OmpA family protein [Shewanella profunda]
MNISLLHWIKLTLLILGLSLTSQVYAWQDTDQDGVPNIKDACPNTPANTEVLANGCPYEAEVITDNIQCDINDPSTYSSADCHNIATAIVYFEFAIAEVDLSQWKTLALVKAFLEANDVALVLVGHTDIVGTPEFNYQLSLQRAENVRRVLVEDYGFNPNRFTVIGKGISEPVADNRSSEGRRLNRRVQFIVNNK